MKINRYLFKNKEYSLEDDIDFSNQKTDPNHIRKISNTHVKVSGFDYDDYLLLNITVDSDVIGVCSYSLEDVPLHLHFSTELAFTYDEEDEDNYVIKEAIFDLDPYIFDLIISEVPYTLVKKGAMLPKSGNGYRVMSEEEYNKENENKKDSRWSKLDDVEL